MKKFWLILVFSIVSIGWWLNSFKQDSLVVTPHQKIVVKSLNIAANRPPPAKAYPAESPVSITKPQLAALPKPRGYSGYSLILPFQANPLNPRSLSRQQQSWQPPPRRRVTFDNLNHLTPAAPTSSFSCPPQLPYAQDYRLESPLTNIIIYGPIYRNACYDIPTGTKSLHNDLLYGSNQHSDDNGPAAALTAFIPSTLAYGCHQGLAKLDIKLPETAVVVTPLTITLNNEVIISGFKQTIAIEVNCNRLCNHLLNNLCASNWNYCNESISASYYKTGIFHLANLTQHFCACAIQSHYGTSSFTFTNAIDVEQLVNYSNRLTSVSCSNYPD